MKDGSSPHEGKGFDICDDYLDADDPYTTEVRPILDAFDRVRELLNNEIELPQIVVIGDQSSGKSSVLESLTQVAFPKGQNCVTRCPIVVQIRNIAEDQKSFASIKSEATEEFQFKDFNKIPLAIKSVAEKLVSQGELITPKPINLKLFRPNSPDLTVIDLPGLSYQEPLIQKIKDLVTKYITSKSTIILNIVPAHVDFSASESLMISKSVDPNGDRTLCVLTKIDHCEKNILKKIEDNELNLKHPIIAVRNRTQDELDQGLSLEEARQRENEFIANHEELSRLDSSSKGTKALVVKLVELQKEKLLTAKEPMKLKVNEQLTKVTTQLTKLPEACKNDMEICGRFQEYMQGVHHDLNNLIDGNYCDFIDNDTMYLRSREFEVLSGHVKEMKFEKSFLKTEYSQEFAKYLKLTNGMVLPNFNNDQSFKLKFNAEVQNVVEPTERCIDEFGDVLAQIAETLISKWFRSFPNLETALKGSLRATIRKQAEFCKEEMASLIESELNEPYTHDTYYLEMFKAVKEAIFNCNKKQKPCKIKIGDFYLRLDVDTIDYHDSTMDETVLDNQVALYTYWRVFMKRFVDYVHLKLKHNTIFYLKKNITKVLNEEFSPMSGSRQDQVKAWMVQSPSVAGKRKLLTERKRKLQEAKHVLDSVY
eukprot:CAMPEP_0114985458 /NCGR_PEP_ID=MMETSP0216-20121206/7870_1 /TAXON_ID=223996 /ORGANISM="Protocruzia adherens, Strain Boccale" /LENGTH=650 /DNA_ID=CAMNT_0002347761 /DNA_START=71 /DNA_END=2023 /DNA_ORIENTATION=-